MIWDVLGTLTFLCLVYFGISLKAHAYKKREMAIKLKEAVITQEEYDMFLTNHKLITTLSDPKYVWFVATRIPNE